MKFRLPGVNFRNILLVLAITLQLLTYMKHEGASIVGLPATLPIGSPFEAAEPAPSDRADSDSHPTALAETSGFPASAELAQPAEGKPDAAPHRPSSKRAVGTVAPNGFGGGSTGRPIAGAPRPPESIPTVAPAPAPRPISDLAPAPTPAPEPSGAGNVNVNPPPPPPPPPGVSNPPNPVEPAPDRPGTTADGPPPPRLEEPEPIIE